MQTILIQQSIGLLVQYIQQHTYIKQKNELSNNGDAVDIYAVGINRKSSSEQYRLYIWRTFYRFHLLEVAGMCALLLQAHPDWTRQVTN